MQATDLMHRLRLVAAVVNAAGQTALSRFRSRDFTVSAKGRQDLVSDVDRTTEASLREALQLGQTLDGYAGARVNEGAQADDPTDTLLNVRTTADIAVAVQALREVWGGALCVSHAERTYAELRRIQTELMDTGPALGAGIDVPAGQVVMRVIVATTQDQVGLDDRYGVDVVRLQGELVPLATTSG